MCTVYSWCGSGELYLFESVIMTGCDGMLRKDYSTIMKSR